MAKSAATCPTRLGTMEQGVFGATTRTKQVVQMQRTIQPGTMVLIKENNLPPLKWLLGRVTNVHPGPDGVIRVATVHTNLGSKKRAVRLLCPLPIDT
ncbi:unnamed protein product [Macrosiphum euphorbiae]|uniref:DUF5641 domain-containing protein n=1 Tax=Macrosiphum euphorbiae TaxID=13131 RepID=A0AAV0Y793_9HEMI|nr:unnamed protein product [Macrosiphum euphorbiae]